MSAFGTTGDLLRRRWPEHLSEVTVHKVIHGAVAYRPGIHCQVCAVTIPADTLRSKARALWQHRRCRFL